MLKKIVYPTCSVNFIFQIVLLKIKDSLFLKSSKFEDGACVCAVKYFKHNNFIKTYWHEYFLSCCGPEIVNIVQRFERYFSHH